jgi:nucleoside-diphosphate-sugar epimerase
MEDVVAATLEAVRQDIKGSVNLGLGRVTSFNDLATLVASECGYSPEFERIIGAPEGVQYRVCDPTKMLSFYNPKISLEEGISRSVNYLRNR